VDPLKPCKLSEKYMYFFFDTECTQDLEKSDGSFEHGPNLVCAQQMCSKCIAVGNMNDDCKHYDQRTHAFWETPVGKFIISGCPDHSRTKCMS
jgi:hypothetical protein